MEFKTKEQLKKDFDRITDFSSDEEFVKLEKAYKKSRKNIAKYVSNLRKFGLDIMAHEVEKYITNFDAKYQLILKEKKENFWKFYLDEYEKFTAKCIAAESK